MQSTYETFIFKQHIYLPIISQCSRMPSTSSNINLDIHSGYYRYETEFKHKMSQKLTRKKTAHSISPISVHISVSLYQKSTSLKCRFSASLSNTSLHPFYKLSCLHCTKLNYCTLIMPRHYIWGTLRLDDGSVFIERFQTTNYKK